MDSLYLLIPLSLVLILAIGGLLAWSVMGGQFDDLDAQARRILDDDKADASLAARGKVSELTSTARNDDGGSTRGGD